MENNKMLQLKGFNFGNLPDDKREEFLQNMNDIIFDRVLIRVFKDFTSKEIEYFNDLLDEAKDKEAIDFLRKKTPSFDDVLEEEIKKFEEEIVQILA